MGKTYTLDLREKVIGYIERGGGKREASQIFEIGEDTIYRWLRLRKLGSLAPKKRVSTPHKVDPEAVLRYVDAHPDQTLKEMSKGLGFSLTQVHRWLIRLKITRKKRPRGMGKDALKRGQSLRKRSTP